MPERSSTGQHAVLVCGSREWPYDQWTTIYDVLDRYAEALGERFVILHGGAMGADSWAAEWGQTQPHVEEVYLYEPKYDQHGKRAPHVRNDLMLDEADHVIAFWDGKSRGTKSVIDKAIKRGLSFEVHSPAGVYVEV